MKNKKQRRKMIYKVLVITSLIILGINLGFFILMISGEKGTLVYQKEAYQKGLNDSQINITNAYLEGALYTYQTRKMVVPEQTINGVQIKEYPLEEICNNLNQKEVK